jgi:hypothetical protein
MSSEEKHETKKLSFHIRSCNGCKSWTTVCNRVLFGMRPPDHCPIILEHIIGDQEGEE